MNIVKNNQNIANEVALNEPAKVESLTYYIANVFGSRNRKIRDTGYQPITQRGKRAIAANKIVGTIHSATTPSPFRPIAYLIDCTVPEIASSRSRNIAKIIVRFTNERILNLLPGSVVQIAGLVDTFAGRNS